MCALIKFDHFEVPQSTLSKLLSNKEAIKTKYFSGETNLETKRQCHPKFEYKDKALLTWFRNVRASDTCVNGPSFLAKANELLQQEGLVEELSATWISRWKSQHGMKLATISGESGSVQTEVVDSWRTNQLASMLAS